MNFTYVTNIEKLGTFQNDLIVTNYIAFDTETTGLDWLTDNLTLIQMKANNNIYIFDCTKLPDNIISYIIYLVKGSCKPVIGHNINFDLKFIYKKTGIILTEARDTQIAEILIRNGMDKTRYYSLDYLTGKYLQIDLNKDIRKSFINNQEITQEKLLYSAEDVNYLEDILLIQLDKLREQKQMAVFELECKIIPVIISMETNGIKIDKERWKAVLDESQIYCDQLEDKLINTIVDDAMAKLSYNNAFELISQMGRKLKTKKEENVLKTIIGCDFIREYVKSTINLNSNTQLLAIFNNVYKIGIDNTNEKVLAKKATKYPIITTLIKYRGFSREISGFSDGYLEKINPLTGRLHTNYNQLGAVTGRFSSEKPNMQNVKGKDDEGVSKFRPCFIADNGKVLVTADYSQQELRILADVTRDPKMVEIFEKGLDPHQMTASGLFKIPYEEVTKDQRKKGKTLNFAVGYGSSEFGLEYNFDIPIAEGKVYLKEYHRFYSGYTQYVAYISEKIWEHQYSVTLLGRRRFFEKPKIYKSPKAAEAFKAGVLRSLVNHTVQGTGADITKLALVRIFNNNPFGDKLKILLQVHDEIVLECPEEIGEQVKDFVTEQMLLAEGKFLKVIKPAVDTNISKVWEH